MIQDATLEMPSEKNKSFMLTFPSGLKHLNFVLELPLSPLYINQKRSKNKVIELKNSI